ncbi:hypothetical protein AB0D54_11870 [Streptomyces xanthophaeus]|uniref:hypothetical protein n=1 Tax=Streptomyces xanthophaeus TaxID=67385 RepID=UPI003440DCF1
MNHLLLGLAANPALPSRLTDRLLALLAAGPPARAGDEDFDEDFTDELADELADRADLSRAQTVALAAYAEHTALYLAYKGKLAAADIDPVAQPYVAVALLDSGTAPPAWARLLAAHPDPLVREKLASCPVLPAEAAPLLAADPEVAVVAELALWASADVAAGLARHPHAEVRRAASCNESVPPEALAALITGDGLPAAASCLVCDQEEIPFRHDPDCLLPYCRLRPDAACDGSHGSTVLETLHWTARNPSTPPEAAASLIGHPSMPVRWELAERTDLPEPLYERLAVDPTPQVRDAVAANPAIGESLVRALAADPRQEVRRSVARHPRLPLDLLAEPAAVGAAGPGPLPRISAATAAELVELAASPHGAVRMRVAERHDLPPELRDALAADPDASVVKAVAPHPGLSEEQLRAMVARHGVQVLARVAANPDAPGTLLAELARHEPPVRRALYEIAVHPRSTAEALLPCLADSKAGQYAASHPALAPSVLAGLLAGPSRALAQAAASNPSLPTALMEELVTRCAERRPPAAAAP